MQIYRHFHQADGTSLALAIGNFDGVHLGHQAMLTRLKEVAAARGLKSAIMTFEPHPREFFSPTNAPARLSSLREKLERFAEAGVDKVYVCHFNHRFAAIDADDFISRVLRSILKVRVALIGQDFRFGAGRRGTRSDFDAAGIETVSLPDVTHEGRRVSSTAVREALAIGDLAHAEQLLGRKYSISGKIVHGDKVGRVLGYPTANIHMLWIKPSLFVVYAVKLEGLSESLLPGVASLGLRPTVKQGGKPTLEVHLFDFNQDVYGRHVRVHFLHKIRDEMKFADIDTLKAWIASDACKAREYFKYST